MAITKVSRNLLNTGVSDSSDATAITIDSSENCTFTGTTTTTGYVINNNTALFDDHSTLSAYSDTNGVYLNGKNAGWLSLSGDGTQRNNVRIYGQASSSGELIQFKTANSERMRIDSSGRMFLGGTSGFGNGFFEVNASPTSFNHIVTRPTVNTTYNALRMINNANTVIGTISVGTSVNTVTYGGTSDYRLKENIQPMEQGLERVKKLNPVKFDWKETGESSEGFIAHEIQDAGWNLGVVGKKDGKEMQEVEYGKLTPLLVKAIQEQQEIIDDLKTRIEELEA